MDAKLQERENGLRVQLAEAQERYETQMAKLSEALVNGKTDAKASAELAQLGPMIPALEQAIQSVHAELVLAQQAEGQQRSEAAQAKRAEQEKRAGVLLVQAHDLTVQLCPILDEVKHIGGVYGACVPQDFVRMARNQPQRWESGHPDLFGLPRDDSVAREAERGRQERKRLAALRVKELQRSRTQVANSQAQCYDVDAAERARLGTVLAGLDESLTQAEYELSSLGA